MDIDKTRAKLRAATLAQVPFDGWTGRALRAGAAAAGLDPASELNAFPGGPAELIESFSAETDRRMLAKLEKRDLASIAFSELSAQVDSFRAFSLLSSVASVAIA